MATIDLQLLKKLRSETSASVSDCRRALDESEGDYKKALMWLKKRAAAIAEKKSDRTTDQGIVEAYIHAGGKVGVLVELLCETDFVARTDEFKHLAREIGMQVAAMKPESVESLLKQEYIRDGSLKISDLVKGSIGKLGENITVKKFTRFAIGE
jgi:elongation factor Ts